MADKKISALTGAATPLAGTEVLPIVQSGSTVKATVENVFNTTQPSGTANGVVYLNASKRATSGGAFTFDGSNLAYLNGTTFGLFRVTADASNVAGVDLGTVASPDVCRIRYNNATNALGVRTNGVDAVTVDSAQNLKLESGNLIQGTAAKGINFTANTPAAGMTSQLLNWYEEGTWTPNQGAGLTLVGAFSSAGTYTRIGRQVFIRGSVSGVTSVAVASAGAITTNLPYSAAADATGTAIDAANNASSILRVSSATLTAATAIAATTTITFSAVYSV